MKIGLALSGLLLLSLLAGEGRGGEFPVPSKPLPPERHNPKVESFLEELALQLQAQGLLPGGGLGAVVEFADEASPSDLAGLRALGVGVEASSGKLARTLIPLDRLDEVAKLPRVLFVRRAYRPVVLEEALGHFGAVLFHAHGFRGQGVRMAVIDVGFGGLSWATRQGALPWKAIADRLDYTGEGLEEGTNHGTAVAELAHAVAPQAQLYLMKIGDEVDLGRAVDDCLRRGIQIILHSVGWFNTNFTDGRGIIDELAGRAHRAGILWVNAAGNHAQAHWAGPFRDGDGDGWAEFEGFEESLRVRASFGQIQLFLTWDDWPRTCQDYDLFLYDASGELLASSQNYQSCLEPPAEELQHVVLRPGIYYARVLARNRLNPTSVKIFSAGAQLQPAVPQGSLPAPADAREALAVGALSIGLWDRGPQESFSSQGPTHDGRIKPELMGPDNIRTFTEIGLLHRFSGTSAAAPHVAGAAALLLSQHPTWTVDQIWRELERSSIDMGLRGKDNIYGSGRLDLSLGRPTARRSMETSIRPGDKAVQGGSFLVTILLKMPPSLFGGLVLQEQLPPGFELLPQMNDGGQFDREKLEWLWPIVEPGAVKKVVYRVIVPPDQELGVYTMGGRINGEMVGGEAQVEVIRPLAVAQAVAHWDGELIDLELDDRIGQEQLEQAIRWWLADLEVPGTAGRVLGSGELERLTAHWLTGTPVGVLLPPLPGWGAAGATRAMASEPQGSLLVMVEIEARSKVHGLRLREVWAPGWRIERLDSADVVFKGSSGEWLWPQVIEAGEVLRVSYRAWPPDEPSLEGEVRGVISSALPRFGQLVQGQQRAELAAPGLELGSVQALNVESGIRFIAQGQGIAEVRVRLYNLTGQRIYDSGWGKNGVLWSVNGQGGISLANGVYLYLLSVRDGKGHLVQRLGKVAILR